MVSYRFYAPKMRAFLSRDPTADDSLGDLYAAFENNPGIYTDPVGLDDWSEFLSYMKYANPKHYWESAKNLSKNTVGEGLFIGRDAILGWIGDGGSYAPASKMVKSVFGPGKIIAKDPIGAANNILRNTGNKIYRFFGDNAGTVHFSGIITKSKVPVSVREQLGLRQKGK